MIQKKTCIVIPCYNEAKRLKVEEFSRFLATIPDIDLCFVNDGSSDGTLSLLEDFSCSAPERILVVDCAENGGKAEAVRQGMKQLIALDRYQWLGFADADLATPLEEMERLARLAGEEGSEMVMGARLKRMGANIERKLFRHYTGRVFATVVSVLFHLNAYDTQCGAKIFTAGLAESVFEKPFISRWLFDVEMLLRIKRQRPDYTRIIKEIPLNTWIEQGDSKIRFSHLLQMPVQLCKIYFNYKS